MRIVLSTGLLLLLACGSTSVQGGLPGEDVSDRDETTLGEATHPRVVQEFDGLYENAELAAYVNQVGARVAAVVQKHYPRSFRYRIHILNTSIVNVFSLLGGNLYVTRGLLAACMNEDQLAGALAHALIHSASHHTSARLSQEITLPPFAAELREGVHTLDEPSRTARTWWTLTRTSLALLSLTYTGDQEQGADTHGLRIAYEAGYNPRGFIQFHEMIEKRVASRPRWTTYRNTHSAPGDRIADLEKLLKQYYAEGDRREFTVGKFETAAARLKSEQEAYDSYDQGCLALDKGDSPEAVQLLTKALEMKKNEPLFYRTRGLAYHKSMNFKQAEADFTQALALSTTHESIYLGRADARIRLSRFQDAIEDLTWACRLVKRSSTYYRLGDCCERVRDTAAARKAYVNCIALAGYAIDSVPENAPEEIRLAVSRLSNLK